MNNCDIYIWVERAIDGLYRVLMGVTLLGVVTLLNQHVTALSGKAFFIGFVILFILYLGYIFIPRKSIDHIQHKITSLFRRISQLFEGKNLFFIFLGLFASQFVLVFILSGYTDWDVGGIFDYTKLLMQDNNATKINEYLSKNPNNAFFFFIMYAWSAFGNLLSDGLGNDWYFWQFLNIIVIDIGIYFLYLTAQTYFSKNTGIIAMIMAVLTLGLSGWLLVPYTDTFAFTITAILLYLLMKRDIQRKYDPILLGFLLCMGYLIKPSLLIPYIAFIIIRICTRQIKWKDSIITLLCFFLGFFGYQYQLANQDIIVLDPDQSKPWALFVMMGLKDDGGYNYDDTIYIRNAGDTEAGNELALQVIRDRLTDYGLAGYTKFLWSKQQYNTKSGTFSMGADGSGLLSMNVPQTGLRHYLRSIYFPDGSRHHLGQFVAQMIWCVVIFTALCVPRYGKKISFLKLTIIGLFVFLLMFEAGRSRYLIQQLPTFLLLSSLGIKCLYYKCREKISKK